MILYFSGTGNSAYVAEKIAKEVRDEAVSMNDKMKSGDYAKLDSAAPWVFVTPTYAWRIPRVVQEWIARVDFHGNRQAYFIMTCGDAIGNAGKYAKELCVQKGFCYMGCLQIVMPENYIAMFPVPQRAEAERIIAKAAPEITAAGELIRERKAFPDRRIRFGDKVSSGPVNNIFYPVFVHAKKFYSTAACIGCGHCAKVCPLNNVAMEGGRPKWGDCCTHCMACICECPKEAIEYGNKSKGKPRYRCPGRVE